MSGDKFHISGPITGSNIGGKDNVVFNESNRIVVRTRLDKLIDDARSRARALPEGLPARTEFLNELDAVQQNIHADADRATVTRRLDRLKEWAEALGLVAVATDIVTAVKAWFASGAGT